MKKWFVIVFIFLIPLIPLNVKAISASSAIAMDLDNDQIFFGYNYNDQRLIASITKIMTAIVTIEYGSLEKEVVVGKEIKEAYGSAIYIKEGERLTISDLLYGLMLRSGNELA